MPSLVAMSVSAATGRDAGSTAPLGHGALRAVTGRGAALLASACWHASCQPTVHSSSTVVSSAAEDCRRQRYRRKAAPGIPNMDITASVPVLRKRPVDRGDRPVRDHIVIAP